MSEFLQFIDERVGRPRRSRRRLVSREENRERKERFRRAWKNLGVTARQVAEKLDISPTTVRSYGSYGYVSNIPSLGLLLKIEALTDGDFPKGRIDHVRRRDAASNTDMMRRLLAGETLQSISESYGITRERVRQIVAKQGVANPRHEGAALNRQKTVAERAQKRAAREAVLADRAERLAKARDLVENEGWSIRKAMASVGFTRSNDRFARGWKTRYGRWNPDTPKHYRMAVALWGAGLAVSEIAEQLNRSPHFVSTALEMHGVDWRVGRRKYRPPRPPRPKAERGPRTAHLKFVMDDVLVSKEWPAEPLSRMIEMWNANKSASYIARELGPPYTRNSVLGKINRMRKRQ